MDNRKFVMQCLCLVVVVFMLGWFFPWNVLVPLNVLGFVLLYFLTAKEIKKQMIVFLKAMIFYWAVLCGGMLTVVAWGVCFLHHCIAIARS